MRLRRIVIAMLEPGVRLIGGILMLQGEKGGYFEEALSDFMFDVAAGGAIRHLADSGYSAEQIRRKLDYPVPLARIEKAVCRHMTETGILLAELPVSEKDMQIQLLQGAEKGRLSDILNRQLAENGEKNSYMECPFGKWKKDEGEKLSRILDCLNGREQEYLLGIRFEKNVMYHRLNGRMREIGLKLAAHTEEEWKFYFLQSQKILRVK